MSKYGNFNELFWNAFKLLVSKNDRGFLQEVVLGMRLKKMNLLLIHYNLWETNYVGFHGYK